MLGPRAVEATGDGTLPRHAPRHAVQGRIVLHTYRNRPTRSVRDARVLSVSGWFAGKDNMAKKMLIDATHPEETRVVVVDGTKVEEFDFESLNKRQLAGNIYLAKVTRVEPSLQAAFVDYGGNRHGFLAFSEIHPDYYQIPVADREALLAEEREYAEAMAAEAEEEVKPKRRRSRRRKSNDTKAEATDADAVTRGTPSGMDVVNLDEGSEDGDAATPVADADATEAETPESVDAPEAADGAEVAEPDADTAETEAPTEADAPAEDAVPDASEDGGADEADDESDDDGSDDDDGEEAAPKAETVADDDTEEDIRPVRKPRPRKYKIQEVVKVRQIMLVQVVKEERGNKGAALTTYLSLAGRYCVLMPNTARGGGISRKITNAVDRKKLKEIATSLDVPQGRGPDHPHRRKPTHQDRDQARLRVPPTPMGTGA
jgi:ribonuclease E